MIVRRIGAKDKIAPKIQYYFPNHYIYIEPFFGRGSMFFNKPKVKMNILNDNDSDVFNLFNLVMTDKDALYDAFKKLPIHQDLLVYWKQNKESQPIMKALRFLFLSNFTYLGKQDTISYRPSCGDKNIFYRNIDKCFDYLDGVKFHNADFEKFIKDISFPKMDFGKPSTAKDNAFIYADPPYVGAVNTYEDEWSFSNYKRLVDCLIAKGVKFAISEFDNKDVIEYAKSKGLNIYYITDRVNLKNRKTEILIINYENRQQKLF